jgi:hypothetical protein
MTLTPRGTKKRVMTLTWVALRFGHYQFRLRRETLLLRIDHLPNERSGGAVDESDELSTGDPPASLSPYRLPKYTGFL